MKEEFFGQNFSEKFQTIKTGISVDYDCAMEESIEGCESPIEKLMALALFNEMHSQEFIHNCIEAGCEMGVHTQQEIVGTKYRADFVIDTCDRSSNGKLYAIECDEYEFHEKTKEQVIHDKEREREIVAAGYVVIRFSGSEIFKRPLHCAEEAIKIIFENLKQGQ